MNAQMTLVSELDIFILVPMWKFNPKGHNLDDSHLEEVVEWPGRPEVSLKDLRPRLSYGAVDTKASPAGGPSARYSVMYLE